MTYLLVPAGATFLAILTLPIDAYHLIRWVVFGFCTYAILFSRQPRNPFPGRLVPLVVIATLYNPIVPFYFSRGTWVANDIVAGAYLAWLATRATQTSSSSRDTEQQNGGTECPRMQQPRTTPFIESTHRFGELEKTADKVAKALAIGAVFTLILIFVFHAFIAK